MQLRPYQTDFIAGCLAALQTSRSTLGILPTGCGKTVCFNQLGADWPEGDILILAHRVELLDQAAEKFQQMTGLPAWVEQAERTAPPLLLSERTVLVASVPSLTKKRLARPQFDPSRFGIIIIDEAHHATAKTYKNILVHFGVMTVEERPSGKKRFRIRPLSEGGRIRLLGVTATPKRHDETALGTVFETVGFRYEIWDAVQDGWLVLPNQRIVQVEGLDLTSIDIEGRDFSDADLERLMVEEGPLHKVADSTVREVGERQAIVFTSGVAHAHLLAEIFNRHRAGSAGAVDGGTPPDERARIMGQFKRGELQYLCNFGITTEGFDHPGTGAVVMARPTKSVGLYTQMLGRGTRPLPGLVDGLDTAEERRAAIAASAKPDVLVLDFVGNSQHKLVTAIDVLGGKWRTGVIERAAELAAAAGGGNPQEHLEQAEKEKVAEVVREVRQKLKLRAQYTTQEVSPFDAQEAAPVQREVASFRGTATDNQLALLEKLGVPRETSARYSKKQAGAVINNVKAKRCTINQGQFLERRGYDPSKYNYTTASLLIDKLKSGRAAV